MPWNAHSVRGARCCYRSGHWTLLSPSPRTGVSPLAARDRTQRPARTRCAPSHGELRHPQNAGDPKVARLAAEMASSLHAHRQFMGRSSRALLRKHHRKADPPRRPSLHGRTESSDPELTLTPSAPIPIPLLDNSPTTSPPPSSDSASRRSKSPQDAIVIPSISSGVERCLPGQAEAPPAWRSWSHSTTSGAAFGNAVFPHGCEPAPGFDAFARGHRHETM